MEKNEVKMGEWIENGFKLYKENFGLLVLASLIGGALSIVTMGILSGPMMAGLTLIIFALKRKTAPAPEVKTLFDGFSHFLPTFLLWLIVTIICLLVSIILNFIPFLGQVLSIGLVLTAVSLQIFSVYLIVDKGMDFWPALNEVIGIMKANLWPFLGFFIVAALIGQVGAIACGIGAVLTFPICFCILAEAYDDIYR